MEMNRDYLRVTQLWDWLTRFGIRGLPPSNHLTPNRQATMPRWDVWRSALAVPQLAKSSLKNAVKRVNDAFKCGRQLRWVEIRTVAGPSSHVQWVLSGGLYTVWSQARHVKWCPRQAADRRALARGPDGVRWSSAWAGA